MPLENTINDFRFHPYIDEKGHLEFPSSEEKSILFALKICVLYRERNLLLEEKIINAEKIIDFEKSISFYLKNEIEAQLAKRQFERRNETIHLVVGISVSGIGGMLLGCILVALLKR